MLHLGQTPTRKDTGELEAILPDWLKDVRQQARSSAEEDAAQASAQPKVEKDKPPDFLAGLVSQAGDAGEDEVPDWLASIRPDVDRNPTPPSTPEPAESDFFAQFNRSEAQSASQPAQPDDVPAFEAAAEPLSDSTENDDLSKWFARAAEQPEEVVQFDPESGHPDSIMPPREEPAPKEEEDLSWLHNLESVAKQTGDLPAPRQGSDWMANFETPSAPSGPSGSQEDLSWLDNLGGIDESPQRASGQPVTSGDDLSWLDNIGATPQPAPYDPSADQPASAPPFVPGEDLSWLNNLGGTAETSAPAEASSDSGSAPSPQDDLSWLSNLGGETAPAFTPPFTEPEAAPEASPQQATPLGKEEIEPPDWLKSAMETPSMPAPGDVSMDWFANQAASAEEKPPPATPSEPTPASSQDVDSLFSVEMPEWLSHAEPVTEEPAPLDAAPTPTASEKSLAPVDLPSWVQAMRPVEAVISETATGAEEEPEEKEGPLAGLHGVIPGAVMGSAIRPKAISLKLQATHEQQAGAALLEKILSSETNPRALVTPSFIWSQRWLRRALLGLFVIVLGIVIGVRSQTMQVYADLPAAGGAASTAVAGLPAGARVLVVIDYEPSLAGELEAIGGPLLDQMTLLHNPELSFVSTSPNGSALVERLISNTGIRQLNVTYRNLGFLPGGPSGALGFVRGPSIILPAAQVESFSEYAMVVLMTDQAESGRVWVEQLHTQRAVLGSQPLIVIASAQAGPLLQPYLSSNQITGMISGLSEGARYEYKNGTRPGIARAYADAFGIGLAMAVVLIILGSLWSLFTGIRARRAEAEQG
jgi:hypothetical protein